MLTQPLLVPGTARAAVGPAFSSCATTQPSAGVVPIAGEQTDLTLSADGATAYVSTDQGLLWPVALPSAVRGCSLDLGPSVGGLDTGLAADQLYVATGSTVTEVDAAAWTVRRRFALGLATDEVALDVGVVSSGHVFVSTSARRVLELVPSTGATSVRQGMTDIYNGLIESSRDHRVLVIAAGGESSGTVELYRAANDQVVRRSLWKDFNQVSIDGTGDRVVLYNSFGAILIDGAAHVVGTASIRDTPYVAGVAVAGDGQSGWAVLRDGTAHRFDAGAAFTGSSLTLPGTYYRAGSGTIGSAVLSPAGQLLVFNDSGLGVADTSGASPADPPLPCGRALNAAGWAALPAEPTGVVVSDDSTTAWVAVGDKNIVVPINLAAKSLGCPVRVGSGPHGLALTADGSRLLVANTGGEEVSVVDTVGRTVTSQISVPWLNGDGPSSVVLATDGTGLVLTDQQNGYGGRLVRIQLGTTTSATDPRGATRLAASGDRRFALMSNGSNDLMRSTLIDLATKGSVLEQDLGGQAGAFAQDLAVSNDAATSLIGRFVRYSGYDVAILNRQLDIVGTIPMETWGVTIAPDGQRAWLSHPGEVVEADLHNPADPLQLRSLQVQDLTRASNNYSGDLAISRDGTSLVVLTETGVAALRPAGVTPPTSPSPSPSSSATPRATSSPSASASAVATSTPYPSASPSPSPRPSPLPTSTPSPSPRLSPSPSGSPSPRPSSSPTVSASASRSPIASPTTTAGAAGGSSPSAAPVLGPPSMPDGSGGSAPSSAAPLLGPPGLPAELPVPTLPQMSPGSTSTTGPMNPGFTGTDSGVASGAFAAPEPVTAVSARQTSQGVRITWTNPLPTLPDVPTTTVVRLATGDQPPSSSAGKVLARGQLTTLLWRPGRSDTDYSIAIYRVTADGRVSRQAPLIFGGTKLTLTTGHQPHAEVLHGWLVRHHDRRPLPSRVVQVYARTSSTAPWRPVASIRTRADGRFVWTAPTRAGVLYRARFLGLGAYLPSAYA